MNVKLIAEYFAIKDFIKNKYPSGLVSLVSDSFNYWNVVSKIIPALKEDILARPVNALGLSKVVIRPDSGNPADIICGFRVIDFDKADSYLLDGNEDVLEDEFDTISKDGKYYNFYVSCDKDYGSTIVLLSEVSEAEVKGSIELLWETFGGTITEQGYKVLDSHIGLIYGDSITLKVALDIFKRLEAKGFASTNVVFGVGSYSLQYVTRDSLGIAVKATAAKVNGEWLELFKDPKTDSGMKKSAKGLLKVTKDEDGNFILNDQQTPEQEEQGELKVVFENGQLVHETSLSAIRDRLWNK